MIKKEYHVSVDFTNLGGVDDGLRTLADKIRGVSETYIRVVGLEGTSRNSFRAKASTFNLQEAEKIESDIKELLGKKVNQ